MIGITTNKLAYYYDLSIDRSVVRKCLTSSAYYEMVMSKLNNTSFVIRKLSTILTTASANCSRNFYNIIIFYMISSL